MYCRQLSLIIVLSFFFSHQKSRTSNEIIKGDKNTHKKVVVGNLA